MRSSKTVSRRRAAYAPKGKSCSRVLQPEVNMQVASSFGNTDIGHSPASRLAPPPHDDGPLCLEAVQMSEANSVDISGWLWLCVTSNVEGGFDGTF